MSIELSSKLRQPAPGQIRHWCPACHCGHVFNVDAPNASGAVWGWDGNVDRPTFRPSMHIQTGEWTDADGMRRRAATVCHYFLIDGQITFCNDSPHRLAGMTVDLPVFPYGRR